MTRTVLPDNRASPGRNNRATGSFVYPTMRELINILKALGANRYDLVLPETNYLPQVLHVDEKILGVVYGRYVRTDHQETIGRAMFVATDQRILLLDVKPVFKNYDEFTYDAIGGVNYRHVAFADNVVLHIAGGDIRMRTFNDKCARLFVQAIEQQLETL